MFNPHKTGLTRLFLCVYCIQTEYQCLTLSLRQQAYLGYFKIKTKNFCNPKLVEVALKKLEVYFFNIKSMINNTELWIILLLDG